jgi:tetratricopeptide (TPR) repeat protein
VALIRDGRLSEGMACLRETAIASLDPQVRREAWARLGENELRSGAPGEAGKAFARALAAPGVAAEAWRVRLWEGAARAAAGDARGAVTALEEAALGPDPAARLLARRWAGWLEWSAGEPARARALWQAGLRAEPPGSAAADSLALDLAESWFARSAWDSVTAILAPAPATDRGWALLGYARYMRGEIVRADSALAEVTEHRAPGSSSDLALLWRAWIALERGEPARTLAFLRRITRPLPPQAILVRYAAALAHVQLGGFEVADSLLARGPAPREGDALARPWTYARAYAQARQGRFAQAEETLGPPPDRPPVDRLDQGMAILRADVNLELGRVADAYTGYVRAASRDAPATDGLLWRQALAALGSEQWGAAARVLDDLLVRFPGAPRTPEFHLWRGEALYRLGRLAEARTHFTRAERLGADAARCAYALGWCDYQEGRWEAALHNFERAGTLGGVGSLDADLARCRVDCLRRLGRDREAAATPDPAADSDEDRARAFMQAGRFREAHTAYQAWMNRLGPDDPRRWEARFQIARSAEALGELRDAATEYAALGAQPGFALQGEAMLRAAALWLRAGEPRRALGLLEGRSTLLLDPAEASRTHALAAQAFEALGEETAAANEWEKVGHAGAGAPDSLRAIGQLHLGRRAFTAGEWGAAYAAFAAADSLGTLDAGARARYWAGESAAQLGACDRAIACFERFLTRDAPEAEWEARARLRLGECYQSQGRPSDARTAYEAVLRLSGVTEGLRRQVDERLKALDAAPSPGPR